MNNPLHPNNPRNNPKHKERGRRRFVFTYLHLSNLLNMTEASVRQAVKQNRLDPENLHSICEYWVSTYRPIHK